MDELNHISGARNSAKEKAFAKMFHFLGMMNPSLPPPPPPSPSEEFSSSILRTDSNRPVFIIIIIFMIILPSS